MPFVLLHFHKEKGPAGTLQNYRLCRYQWEDCVKKLPSDEVCVLLDMSVYQLFYMDKLPAYAIINDAVEITKKQIHGNMAKLVNAVLHAVQRRGKQIGRASCRERV